MQIVAILLAAGASKRFHGDKLRASYRGRELYLHALDALCRSPVIHQTIVVVSPDFKIPANYADCRFVINPCSQFGMSSSLCTGIRAAPRGTDAYMIALADMPRITPDLIAVISRYYIESGKKIIVPTYQGVNGHPVVISAGFKDDLLMLRGDVGAREIIQKHAQLVGHFELDDDAVVFDVDTPEDLCAKKY